MKKLGLVITDGVGFRNFILSDFIKYTEETFSEVVILSCLPEAVYKTHTNLRVIELDVLKKRLKRGFLEKPKK